MANFTKKFIFIFFVFAVFCAAAPAFAASSRNPFTDVPEGSWVYSAVARLASRGIISGYPDGLYKGSQSMTRYEAASMIARAAADFDSRRASVEDAETLNKLVTEFKDELDVLGARMDVLDKDMGLFRDRLGGWRMSGRIRLDVEYMNAKGINYPGSGSESMGYVGLGDARLNLERSYGDRNSAYFRAQLRAGGGHESREQELDMHYFYAKIPFYYGSFITVGLVEESDLDARFAYETPLMGRYSTWGWFDDAPLPMIRLDANFVILNFTAYAARGEVDAGGTVFNNGEWEPYSSDAWNLFANLDVKLSQRFGFGLGVQYLIHDDWNVANSAAVGKGKAWSNIFTSWFGVDYKLSDGITAHGIIYYQRAKTNDDFWGSGDVTNRPDGGIAWRAALDLDQDVLKFTSLYAEYMRAPSGFFALSGIENNMLLGDVEYDKESFFGSVANHRVSMWKVGANQKWSDKFSTWLFYADINGSASAGYSDVGAGLRQYGGGIEYMYGGNVIFGLNYLKWDGKDDLSDKSYSRVRFTTQTSF